MGEEWLQTASSLLIGLCPCLPQGPSSPKASFNTCAQGQHFLCWLMPHPAAGAVPAGPAPTSPWRERVSCEFGVQPGGVVCSEKGTELGGGHRTATPSWALPGSPDDPLWAVNKQVEPHNQPLPSFLALMSMEAGENSGQGLCFQTKAASISP